MNLVPLKTFWKEWKAHGAKPIENIDIETFDEFFNTIRESPTLLDECSVWVNPQQPIKIHVFTDQTRRLSLGKNIIPMKDFEKYMSCFDLTLYKEVIDELVCLGSKNYQLIRVLGRGCFSTTTEVEIEGQKYAMKICSPKEAKYFEQGSYYGVAPALKEKWLCSSGKVVIIMEKLDGTVRSLNIDESLVPEYFSSVLDLLIQLIEVAKINHNDIHTENIMWKTSDSQLKLYFIDFGLSRRAEADSLKKNICEMLTDLGISPDNPKMSSRQLSFSHDKLFSFDTRRKIVKIIEAKKPGLFTRFTLKNLEVTPEEDLASRTFMKIYFEKGGLLFPFKLKIDPALYNVPEFQTRIKRVLGANVPLEVDYQDAGSIVVSGFYDFQIVPVPKRFSKYIELLRPKEKGKEIGIDPFKIVEDDDFCWCFIHIRHNIPSLVLEKPLPQEKQKALLELGLFYESKYCLAYRVVDYSKLRPI